MKNYVYSFGMQVFNPAFELIGLIDGEVTFANPITKTEQLADTELELRKRAAKKFKLKMSSLTLALSELKLKSSPSEIQMLSE